MYTKARIFAAWFTKKMKHRLLPLSQSSIIYRTRWSINTTINSRNFARSRRAHVLKKRARIDGTHTAEPRETHFEEATVSRRPWALTRWPGVRGLREGLEERRRRRQRAENGGGWWSFSSHHAEDGIDTCFSYQPNRATPTNVHRPPLLTFVVRADGRPTSQADRPCVGGSGGSRGNKSRPSPSSPSSVGQQPRRRTCGTLATLRKAPRSLRAEPRSLAASACDMFNAYIVIAHFYS